MSDNKGNQSKVSYTLRLIAGGYLLYLAYGLFQEIIAGKVIDQKILIIAATIVFTIVGAVLVVTSIRILWRQYKDNNTNNNTDNDNDKDDSES